MVCDTLPFQDAFTHKIWNCYLKEYKRYLPDKMQFLETRSEVKFKVTVTQLWYRPILTSDGSKVRRVYLGARER